MFLTSYPVSLEKSDGEGYFLEKDGTYHAHSNHGCHGDFVNGTYIIEDDKIIFTTKLNDFKDNNSKHIFKFEIEELEENKRIFNGNEMIEYSKILKLDRELFYIFFENDSSYETHKRVGFTELFYFINPIEIPCDSEGEYYRQKIIEFRKFFNLQQLSNEELDKIVLFNKEKECKKACLFVFDLDSICITDNIFCAFYFYGNPFTIIEVKKNGERNLYSTYKQGYINNNEIDDDDDYLEKITDYEDEYIEEELEFILNFNPYDFNFEELKIKRRILSYFNHFKNETFDKNNILNLIQLTKNEVYNGIVLLDNNEKQFIVYPNLWYVIFDKINNTHKVYNYFGEKESEKKLEEIYELRKYKLNIFL